MYPILVKIGPFTLFGHTFNGPTLHTFGVMLAIAILVGSTVLLRETRRLGDPQVTEDRLQRLIWWVVAGVIGGGRLMHCIVEREYFAKHPLKIFAIWEGGLVMYGGIIGVFIAVVTFAFKNKIKVLRLCDLVMPSAFLGDAIGRWGCFFAGDDYGRPLTDTPWAPKWLGVVFTNPDSLVPHAFRGIPLHPTQIYMSLKAFSIAMILFWLTRRKKFDGQVAGWGMILYAFIRSTIELFRGDLDRGYVVEFDVISALPGPDIFSTAQFTSLFAFTLGLLILIMAPRRTLADDLAAANKSASQASGTKAQS